MIDLFKERENSKGEWEFLHTLISLKIVAPLNANAINKDI